MATTPNPYGLNEPNTFNYSNKRVLKMRVSEPIGSRKHDPGAAFNPFSSELSSGGSSTGSLSTLIGSQESPRGSNSGLSVESAINLTSYVNEGYTNRKLANALRRNPVGVKSRQKTAAEIQKNLENAEIRRQVKAGVPAAKLKGGRRRSRKALGGTVPSIQARKSRGRKTRRR